MSDHGEITLSQDVSYAPIYHADSHEEDDAETIRRKDMLIDLRFIKPLHIWMMDKPEDKEEAEVYQTRLLKVDYKDYVINLTKYIEDNSPDITDDNCATTFRVTSLGQSAMLLEKERNRIT